MKHKHSTLLFAMLCLALTMSAQTNGTSAQVNGLKTDSILWADTLRAVTIVGSNVTNYADRDVIRITKDMRRGAGNSAQLVGKIQGFDCDIINNELRYYGSKNILLAVDSVPKMAEYIKELQHVRFDKVEVIHSPSGKWAEYDVVINFHTRPDYEGYEGSLTDNGRVLPNDGNGKGKSLADNTTGGQFTWTKNKWNFAMRYNFNFNQGEYNETTSLADYKTLGIAEQTIKPSTETLHNITHNLFTAVDYQISKDHRVSLTYTLKKHNADNSVVEQKGRAWTASERSETLNSLRADDVESQRHTLGLYYGGNVKGWGLFYDFNYINNLNESDYRYVQNDDFRIDNDFADKMNYVWSNIGFNKRFDRYYLTASHSFTYKGYERKNRLTNIRLSENNYYRNQLTVWMSYRFSHDTELTLGARLAHVHANSMQEDNFDNNAALSSTLFHRFNKQTWLRINYWYDAVNPELNQIVNEGYFTDSLRYHAGNPQLLTSVTQRGRIWLNCFGMLGLQAGFNYAPKQFADIIYPYSIGTPQGITNDYIAERTENAKYRELWYAVNLSRKVGDFNLNAFVKYQNMCAEYGNDKADNDGFSGYATLRHYCKPLSLTTEIGYHYNAYYGVSPQGYEKREMDFFRLSVSKDWLRDGRLSCTLQFQPAIHFTHMKYSTLTDSPILYSRTVQGILESNRNVLRFSLAYRFAGGKSVRKYTHAISEED